MHCEISQLTKQRKIKMGVAILAVLLLATVVGCSREPEVVEKIVIKEVPVETVIIKEVVVTATVAPTLSRLQPTATPTPTSQPTTTPTPEPSATPVPPTSTPQPTATLIPSTSTPDPTSTPVPPTSTPQPTSTPVPPTSTPEPTSTPVLPTSTPRSTATPVSPPTNTPIPTLTPVLIRNEPENDYYTQFADVRGVTIKANERVDPEALQRVGRIVALMLDGRPDIAECLSEDWDSEYAVFPKDAPITDLPDFADLKGRVGGDGRRYDEVGHFTGLGATKYSPVSAISEMSVFPDPEYSYLGPWTTVHEFAHHLMNLCFSEDEYHVWERLHFETAQADLGYGSSVMRNPDEFFAELSEAYFSVSYFIPRRHLSYFPPGVFEQLESVYGVLTPVETEDPRFILHVTEGRVPTPWLTSADGTFEHDTFGYTLELLSGWEVEEEGIYKSVLTPGRSSQLKIEITYSSLSDDIDADDELLRLAEQERARWKRWTQDYEEAEVKSFELESLGGQDSYWIRLYERHSTKYCDMDRVLRVLVTSHGERNYGVVISGRACGRDARARANMQDIENILRSFTP